MAFYFVTGKLGNGKSLVSVSRIQEKLRAGLPVATNIDIDLQAMFGKMTKDVRLIRVPDKPSVYDLHAIGRGNESYDESKNGLLVLDECGTWFNARNWQDKSRAEVNNWFLHARKLGWDVILIVQDISIVDNQAREALSEFTAFCKRLDNIRLPLVGGLMKLLSLKLPKIHVARVVYGSSDTDVLSDRWFYRGTDLYSAYDTKQIFLTDYPHGPHSVLPPYYINKRTHAARGWGFLMRLTKVYLRRLRAPLAIFAGVLTGLVIAYVMTVHMNDRFYREYQLLIEATSKLEAAAAASSGSISADPLAPDPSELFDLVEGFRIVGYARYSEHVVYELGRPVSTQGDAEPEYRTVRTDELGTLFSVRPMGPCHVRLLVSDGAHKDVYCF